MRYRLILIISTTVLIIFSSCTQKILFTQDIKKRLEEKNLDFSKIQFYNSHKIILRRILPFNEANIAKGEIKFENGKYIERIIFNKFTPGVYENSNSTKMDISFENGNNKFIRFNLKGFKNYNNYYQIMISKDKDNYGAIIYDSLEYNVQPGCEETKLLVKKKEIYKLEISQRIVKGKKVR